MPGDTPTEDVLVGPALMLCISFSCLLVIWKNTQTPFSSSSPHTGPLFGVFLFFTLERDCPSEKGYGFQCLESPSPIVIELIPPPRCTQSDLHRYSRRTLVSNFPMSTRAFGSRSSAGHLEPIVIVPPECRLSSIPVSSVLSLSFF